MVGLSSLSSVLLQGDPHFLSSPGGGPSLFFHEAWLLVNVSKLLSYLWILRNIAFMVEAKPFLMTFTWANSSMSSSHQPS